MCKKNKNEVRSSFLNEKLYMYLNIIFKNWYNIKLISVYIFIILIYCFIYLFGFCSRVLLIDFLMLNFSSRWVKFGVGWFRDFSKVWSKNCLVEFLMKFIFVELFIYILKIRLWKIIIFSIVKFLYLYRCYVYIVYVLYENKFILCINCMKMNLIFIKF